MPDPHHATIEQADRLRRVARSAGLSSVDGAVRLPSYSNDAWRIGDVALRICWRGDRGRFGREALLLDRLPADVPHPHLLGAGEDAELSWMLTRWVHDAPPLARVWGTLSRRDEAHAVDQLAAAMAALHAWEPDELDTQVLTARPAAGTTTDLLGSDLNPLPVDRALRLIEPARLLPHVEPGVVDSLFARLESLRHVDPLGTDDGVVVHGDLHLDNILWTGGRIAAIVDFEWARLGPPDLELQPLLRPEEGHPAEIINGLVRAYPALGSHPDLVERLWLYDLAFSLRHLLVWPPDRPSNELPEWHPLCRLPRILDGPTYIERVLADTPA